MRSNKPAQPDPVTDLRDTPLFDMVEVLMFAVPAVTAFAILLALLLRHTNRRGTFAVFPALASLPLVLIEPVVGWSAVAASVCGGAARESWRLGDIKKGHDKARLGRAAIGVRQSIRNWRDRGRLADGTFCDDGTYAVGVDEAGGVVRLPLGTDQGRHSLLIGATGSGKTTTMMSAIRSHLDADFGVVLIDAKGDPDTTDLLRRAALADNRPFYSFSLDGDSHHWNPLAHGTPSEKADKLIAAEEWTEPHYKRLYQRYLLNLFTAIDGRGDQADLATVVELLHPERFALYAREISQPQVAAQIDGYLAALTDQERRDLAGLRNRLALLTESEHGELLRSVIDEDARADDPNQLRADEIDLYAAIRQRAVVVFSLNTSRYPETAKLLGAALFQDIKGVAGLIQSQSGPNVPAAFFVDEFGAFGADHILGLFQRARSASISLMLATQELADLRRIDPEFQDQVLGNVEVVIAHRQTVPDSAELVAKVAGTRNVWIHTFQTEQPWVHGPDIGQTGLGTKRRGEEFVVAPGTIKALPVGDAIVVTTNPHRVYEIHAIKREFETQPPHPRDGEHEEWLREQALRYAKAQADRAGIAA